MRWKRVTFVADECRNVISTKKWIPYTYTAWYNEWNVKYRYSRGKYQTSISLEGKGCFRSNFERINRCTCTYNYTLHVHTYIYTLTWKKKFGALKIPTGNSILQLSATKRPRSTISTFSYQEATLSTFSYQEATLPTFSYQEATLSTISYQEQEFYNHLSATKTYRPNYQLLREATLPTISYHVFLGGSLIPPSRFLFNIGSS